MEGLLIILAVLIVVGITVVAVLAIHNAEGVAHLYLPTLFAPLAFMPLSSRPITPPEPERKVEPDGYRDVREVPVDPIGFEPGVWVVGPADKPHSRVTVTSPRTAIVTVLAQSGPPLLRNLQRAIATVRVRRVDTPSGSQLEARALPTCFGIPLSFPLYHAVVALSSSFFVPSALGSSCITGAIALVIVGPIYWVMRRGEIQERTDNALEVLENQLRRETR